jgi:hypothetical protein
VANFGPQPNECISLLAEREIACVQGNCDRDILLSTLADQHADEHTAQISAINDWCRERPTSTSRQWLAALCPRLTPAPGVLIVHGGVEPLHVPLPEAVASETSEPIPGSLLPVVGPKPYTLFGKDFTSLPRTTLVFKRHVDSRRLSLPPRLTSASTLSGLATHEERLCFPSDIPAWAGRFCGAFALNIISHG